MIRNLTPHAITIGDRTIEPSGLVARVAVKLERVGDFDGLPVVRGKYGDVTGLPPMDHNTLLIVSAAVRSARPDRRDLASPADLVRDDAGRIIGCRALEMS